MDDSWFARLAALTGLVGRVSAMIGVLMVAAVFLVIGNSVLIITGELDENLFLAARNLHKVDVRDATGIDPVSLIAFDKVVMTADAVKQVEEMLA